MVKKQVYFIGIGGIGMSALASYYLSRKWAVLGSDESKSSITHDLRKRGANVKIGHKKGHIKPQFSLIIMSQAILPSNPEFLAAKRFGLKILTYPEAVGEITFEHKTVAVAGAHGKSTTTAMASAVAVEAGLDPLVILGAQYKLFGNSNFREGTGPLILEADEFGAAFLNYSPALTAITNIDKEHLDFYKTYANVKKTFLKFISQIKNGGALVLNKDDKKLFSIKEQIEKITIPKNIKVVWYSISDMVATKIKSILKVSGQHNLSNALAAYNLGLAMGIPEDKIFKGIANYTGISRRLENRGNFKGLDPNVPVFDDYAHHPSEIKASLAALKEKYPKSKVICVFQPHQAKRLKALFKDFIFAFKDADAVIFLPTYFVAGRDINEKIYTPQKLSEVISEKYPEKKIIYLADTKKLKAALFCTLKDKSPAVVVLMGAGSITNLVSSLV